MPRVAERAHLVTSDLLVPCEEGGQRRTVFLGGTAAPRAGDEAIELVVAPRAADEREGPGFNDIDEPINERVDVSSSSSTPGYRPTRLMLRAYLSCGFWSTSTFTPGMTNALGSASWNARRAATGPCWCSSSSRPGEGLGPNHAAP